METNNTLAGILALIPQPAFAVREGQIVCVNQAAAGWLISPDTPVSELLHTGLEEYRQFCAGQLYLTLLVGTTHMCASVRRMEDHDIFVLEPAESPQLQALALAARSLREPLAGAMLAADKLRSDDNSEESAQLNRRLHQLLRLVGNMADGEHCLHPSRAHLEVRNAGAVIHEIIEKAAQLLTQTGLQIDYQPLREEILCPLDTEVLERGILNILSNAAKQAPKGQLTIRVTRRNNLLRLAFHDSGAAISDEALAAAHIAYQRPAGLETPDRGIGLGMVMIRAAAAAHEGSVLIDKPQEGGTRLTLTLRILPCKDASFRSKLLRPDYAGERDHAMIELSEQLPAKFYQ